MARQFKPKIVSANDLLAGDVVYIDSTGGWTRRLSEAAVAECEAAAEELFAAADQPGKVVGPYLVEVILDGDGRPVPMHFREKFRDRGPSTRPDLGRQAKILPPQVATGGF
jgi:hypothetical protein